MTAPTPRPRVAVLDDEVNMGKGLSRLLGLEGYDVSVYTDPQEAIAGIRENPVDVLLSDLRMPGMTGEEVLEAVKSFAPQTQIIMMTAYGTVESAMKCVRLGAFDYVTKPFESKALLAAVKQAAASHSRPNVTKSKPQATGDFDLTKLILGESEPIKAVRALISKFAPIDSVVLVTGESGTGKELVAKGVHQLSPRAESPFVAVNCASIPETLIESELFGHEKGAFTGAQDRRIGYMEAASGGTLFLDEIGELPLSMQAKLLRALQEREVTRVGSTAPVPVDIRVIAATNRELDKFVAEGKFREDLYYRLNVLHVKLPPLHKRGSDAEMLARAFLDEFKIKVARPQLEWSQESLEDIKKRRWKGNIRELRNFVERLAVMADSNRIDIRAVEQVIHSGDHIQKLPSAEATGPLLEFQQARDRFEAQYLRKVLTACGGNVTEAARRAGMSRRNFYDKMEKLGVDPTDFKEKDSPE